MLLLNAELWAEEDDDGEEDEEEALSAKQELIQSFNVLGPIVEQAKDMAIQFRDVAKEEVRGISPWCYRLSVMSHICSSAGQDRSADCLEICRDSAFEATAIAA